MNETLPSVYAAGETLPGTDIAMSYVYVSGLVLDERGRARFSQEEAIVLGTLLRAAGELYPDGDDE